MCSHLNKQARMMSLSMQSHGMRLTSSLKEDTCSEFGLKYKLLVARRADFNYGPGRLGRVAAMGSLVML